MNFLLGLFTGATLVILLGIWLNEREKKRWQELKRNEEIFNFWFTRPGPGNELEDELRAAIAREDYKEAARLRDLINRK